MYLLTNPQRVKSVNDLMPMIGWYLNTVTKISLNKIFLGARFYTALDNSIQRTDTLEMELQRDIESARMFRLLTKLGTVVDRTELNMDTAWSETGDRLYFRIKVKPLKILF